MYSIPLVLALIPLALAHGERKYCVSGSTFEDRCLALPYPTAYVDGECIVAVEDDRATGSQVEQQCTALGKMSKVEGHPFRLANKEQLEEIESFLVLKQSGFYYGDRGDKIVPTGGDNYGRPQGYLCAFKDPFGCESGWERYGASCYLPIPMPVPFRTAAAICKDKEGTLPIINDDEQNKFVAMLARKKIFSDSIGQNPIWGSLSYENGEWKHRADVDRKVTYMRFWSYDKGVATVVNNPNDYSASVIFTGLNDDKKVAYFGYWGTDKPTSSLRFICQRPLQKL